MGFQHSREAFRRQLFLNFKGGTGKTTLSAAYGLYLAEKGYSVLFVDLDPQGHLTKCVGINEWQFDKTLYHALLRDVPVAAIVKRIPGTNAHIVPSDMSLSATELSLAALPYREWRLTHALAPLRREYDMAVFDAPPTISLLNLNAALACKDLIVPVLPDSLSLHGLKIVMKTLDSVAADFAHRFVNIGILLNRFDGRDPHCREVRETLRATYGERLLKTAVHEHPETGRQPLQYRFGSRMAVEGRMRDDIRALANEIGPRRKPAAKKEKAGR